MTFATFVAASSGNASAATVPVAAPAGVVSGDHQLALFGIATGSETYSAAPSGWTLLTSLVLNGADTAQLAVYYSDTDTGTANFAKSAARLGYCVRGAWRGGDGFNLSNVHIQNNASSTSQALPAVTTSAADSLVIAACMIDANPGLAQAMSTPPGWTTRFTGTVSAGNGDQDDFGLWDIAVSASGSTVSGTTTITTADASTVFAIELLGAADPFVAPAHALLPRQAQMRASLR